MSFERLDSEEGALAKAADALDRLARIAEKFYAKLYPEKPVVREAFLTRVRSAEEEELEESIQGSESTLEQWKDIGPRERDFIEKEKQRKS